MSFRLSLIAFAAGLAIVVESMTARAQPEPEQPPDAEIPAAPEPTPAPAPTPAPIPAPAPPPTMQAPAAPEVKPTPAPAPEMKPEKPSPEPGIELSGFVQAQYESHQDSEDELRQGGALLNQNRFLIRRARIQAERYWDYSSLLFELDGNTVNGPAFSLFRAEGTLYTNKPVKGGMPSMAALTGGIFLAPFGIEVPESSRTRLWMERSLGSRAFWQTETDVGVRLAGGVSFFRYAIALTNGEPPGSKNSYGLQDPNAHKDVTARFGGDSEIFDGVRVAGGVSFVRGKGFHAGTSATKDSVGWRDFNQNGNVDPGELYGIPGTAATPSQNFDRWAVGADLKLEVKTPIGKASLYGEAVVASNMDRALFVADPILTSQDTREFYWYAALIQEITPYAIAGIRTDYYDPNSDILEKRSNKILPSKQTIRTVSPLVGAVLPDRARLLFQYDFIKDYLARDAVGVPKDFKNNQWTLRLQVNL